ncbi:hypothetical protein B0T21DRAFT_417358 [Apiosordaria backusii]|uniref:Uncharacterized protein n=1 Tax=Apiosordaria backusii TaxID=314023 RepID=A0AA40K5Z9_9PEZI|nr:hypothetical protein B0T21DRAFT_417358 [Apiosordaria backusii]
MLFLKSTIAALSTFPLFLPLGSASPLNIRNDGPQGDFDPQVEQLFGRYNVPYGILGAISHAILIYILGCHIFGRRPLMPWTYLTYHLVNVIVTSCMAIVTVTLAALVISDVQESRALVMLLVMHIIFGLVMDGVSVHRYFYRERNGLMVRLAGWLCVLCVAGLLSNSKRLDDTRWQWSDPGIILIAVMGVGGGVIAVLSFFLIWRSSSLDDEKRRPISASVFFFSGLICALGWFWLADYGPVIVTGNKMGHPRQGGNALFWLYFVFQWVPILTI